MSPWSLIPSSSTMKPLEVSSRREAFAKGTSFPIIYSSLWRSLIKTLQKGPRRRLSTRSASLKEQPQIEPSAVY